MFKRVLSALLSAVLLCSQTAFAYRVEPIQAGITDNAFSIRQPHFRRVGTSPQSILNYTKGNVLFFKDFSSMRNGIDTLNADYSVGSPVATFTATRSATAPATYVDATGKVNLVTSSNTPRIQGGYYDSTGFHAGNAGLMVEGAMTNRATYSGTPENAAWTKTDITADNDDAGSSSPDGVATANSLTATAGNGSFTQAYTDASAGVYAASLWIKRKTGTGVVNLRANTGDAYTAITTSVTSGWTRVSVASSSLTNPTFDLQLVTSGDAVYVYGMQLEKNPYMTSYIPNATTALARGAEVIKYAISGNRRADEESIYVKFSTNWNGSDVASSNDYRVMSTDTKSRSISESSLTDDIIFYPNISDTVGSLVKTGVAVTKNTPMVVSCIAKGATGDPNSIIYQDGNTGVTNNTDWTVPAWGTYFYVGVENNGVNNFLNGVVHSILIIGKANSATEVLANTNLLNAL
jgi:hypothetical protein